MTLSEIGRILERRGMWMSMTAQAELGKRHETIWTYTARVQKGNAVLTTASAKTPHEAKRLAFEKLPKE